MSKNSLSRKMALVGITIGIILGIIYWYDYNYNLFGLPTVEAAASLPSYSEPLASKLFDKIMFILCPGLCLQVFTIGIGGKLVWIMWGIAILLNGLIYYGIGAFISQFIKKRE